VFGLRADAVVDGEQAGGGEEGKTDLNLEMSTEGMLIGERGED